MGRRRQRNISRNRAINYTKKLHIPQFGGENTSEIVECCQRNGYVCSESVEIRYIKALYMKILKIIILLIPVAISLVLLAIWMCNCQINKKSEPYIFDHTAIYPVIKPVYFWARPKYVKSGNPNEYFMNRLKRL